MRKPGLLKGSLKAPGSQCVERWEGVGKGKAGH